MALTGTLTQANAEFFYSAGTDGRLQAIVTITDDVLGPLGARTVAITDPAIYAQVRAFVEQMLPSLSAAVGVPVSLPELPVQPPIPPPDIP